MYVDTGREPAARATGMRVSPDKLTQLAQALQAQCDAVREWLFQNHRRLADIPPPGNDPCSRDTVEVLGSIGLSAANTATAYVTELLRVIGRLRESALAYGVAEETNAGDLRRATS
jgi:hypothetical protein